MSPGAKTPLFENGTILNGKWEILEHIATGGKGEVYRARQATLDRDVVVKTVSLEYLAEFEDDPEEVETEIKRFHREALAMAQVRHPYVVRVYDEDSTQIAKDGVARTVHYVVMEYVPGPTLRSTMPECGFGTDERAARAWIHDCFLPVLDGIEPIHEMGIIHRDIKPENVIMDGTTPKITDFGIAGGRVWPELTRSHHVEGTILYMAPEQFTDLAESDARVDVYALGKILYEVMCGRMVDSKTACPLRSVCLAEALTPFSKGLDAIVRQATAEDKDQRTPSVKALREALLRLLEAAEAAERPLLKGLHRKQKRFIIAAIALLALVIIASNIVHHYYMLHEMPASPPVAAPAELQNPGEGHTTIPGHLPEQGAPTAKIIGKDNVLMHLVPSGEVKLPEYFGAQAGKPFEVLSFYLDETKVTNYKFVEFLNKALSKVIVKEGVVLGEGRPWLFLGPVYGGYDPIVYRDGRFALKDVAFASYPVVRVTGYGALAYAEFYGERLPTELEWLHAASKPDGGGRSSSEHGAPSPRQRSALEQEMEGWISGYGSGNEISGGSTVAPGPSLIPHPVTTFEPNQYGIRGLWANVSEWGLRKGLSEASSAPEYVVLGGLRGSMLLGETLITGVAQEPSGAFRDVGFRCALDPGQDGSHFKSPSKE
ncbi:MAG: protein kinase [Desulfomonile tiedjei]|nr:protein kinase [Desulfomonile tiedjei]